MKQSKVKANVQNKLISQLLRAVLLSVLAFGLVVISLFIAFEVAYADRIYPGVYVHEIDLSGLTFEEAGDQLASVLPYTYEGSLRLTYQDRVWEAAPIDLGYLIDPLRSAQQAYQVGRAGLLPTNLLEKGSAWFNGEQLSPLAFYDEGIALTYLQAIAEEIERPVIEASLSLKNTEVVVEKGQVGLELDIPATLSLITTALTHMESAEIPLIVQETPPLIMDVGAQAEMARQILSEPLVLTASNGDEADRSWIIQPEDLAPMLTITRSEGESEALAYQISVNEDLFGVYLNSLAPGLYISPVNAHFIFNDDTRVLDILEPAVIGRELDVQESISRINHTLKGGSHEVALNFKTLDPPVTNEKTGEELGITELVHQETSYFYGSDAARVQNIRTAAAQFHGLLIPPGATFSMASSLGNISLENGYAEALIIYGGQTIQGVGGGVCQVSTTLFRAAFFAGFPIVERHAHAYRVSYYELRANGSRDPNLAGLDATVYVPIVDLKFTNDTDHWLLMETYMGNYSLTWKFYSTSDGRTVDWSTTGPTNVVPAPDDLYRENPELEKGEIKKVDFAADGADITVRRTVYKNDQVYFSDVFFTQFRPWQAIYEYGPGTELPESATD